MSLSVLPCLILVSMSLLFDLVQSVDAQESLPPISLIDDNRIQSWCADPFMSQTEEQRIIQWLKSRPKSAQQIDVVDELRTELATAAKLHAGVELAFNFTSLEELGIEPDSPASPTQEEVAKPGSDLIRILEVLDLTYMIHRGRIEITTLDAADVHPVVRIYDIMPLLPIVKQRGRSVVSTAPIIEAIQCIIQPDSWEALGGSGTIQTSIVNNQCLLIIASRSDIHIQVQSLLDQLAIAGQLETRSHSLSLSRRTASNGPYVQEEKSSDYTNLFSVPSRGIPMSKW